MTASGDDDLSLLVPVVVVVFFFSIYFLNWHHSVWHRLPPTFNLHHLAHCDMQWTCKTVVFAAYRRHMNDKPAQVLHLIVYTLSTEALYHPVVVDLWSKSVANCEVSLSCRVSYEYGTSVVCFSHHVWQVCPCVQLRFLLTAWSNWALKQMETLIHLSKYLDDFFYIFD